MAARVYITGAAGSGTSTLGRALAERLGVPHLDTDDFFWAPVDPPFTVKRPVEERVALIAAAQLAGGPEGGWVLSGAADPWGEVIFGGVDLIIFMETPTPVRLARLRKRQTERFGARIRQGGDMARNHSDFLKWAASYDDPYFRGRSLERHREWLGDRAEPILKLSGTRPVEDLLTECLASLRGNR